MIYSWNYCQPRRWPWLYWNIGLHWRMEMESGKCEQQGSKWTLCVQVVPAVPSVTVASVDLQVVEQMRVLSVVLNQQLSKFLLFVYLSLYSTRTIQSLAGVMGVPKPVFVLDGLDLWPLTLTFKLVGAMGRNTSSLWIWRKSVQRFPRFETHNKITWRR